jgi:hypothetical protein
MIGHEFETLLQGALDDTLSADERAQLARLINDNPEARERAAELTELAALMASLGPADAPAGLAASVLSQVSHRPHAVRSSTPQRGVAVNKRILFGLAAAAAVVLAVITYYSNPPATVGTEATIGAAQRAQSPQIQPSDVKLGDTSAQDVLQTETFDAIMRDDAVRTALQDPELRQRLQDAELRRALQDDAIRRALSDPELMKKLEDPALKRALDDPEMRKKYLDDPEARKKFSDANLEAMLRNRAFADALRSADFRRKLSEQNIRAALASEAMLRALRDRGFEAALRSRQFEAELASRGKK